MALADSGSILGSRTSSMLTGEIRSQIDQIWNAFWSGGISNPLEVIEQITYLLFLKRLDEQEIAEELKANREKKPMQKRFFPTGLSFSYGGATLRTCPIQPRSPKKSFTSSFPNMTRRVRQVES